MLISSNFQNFIQQKIKFFLISILITQSLSAQHDPFGIFEQMNRMNPKSMTFFQKEKTANSIDNYSMVSMQVEKWLINQDQLLKTKVNVPGLGIKNLILTPIEFTEPSFSILEDRTEGFFIIPTPVTKHYRGYVEGENHSIVSLSIAKGEIWGSILLSGEKQFSIRPSTSSNPDKLICQIQSENQMNHKAKYAGCFTDDVLHFVDQGVELNSRSKDNCNRVSISVHADYALYLKFNKNTSSISNYILGLFNNVQNIYKKEDIQISLAEIIIHSTNDNMPHTTAMEDLESFRRKYTSYKGNVNLLLSGFQKNGIAPLGGIAYIGALCTKSYSYAYCNINGDYSDNPVYSWDIFSMAHELGHVLGSRHTHACVWGPTKNKAIDNCFTYEGSCTGAPTPTKGTIMSYCYLTGKPGVDMTLGFGIEPGNVIREKIRNASCLSTYLPSNKTLSKPDQHIFANNECFDGSWSNYYYDNNTVSDTDDILILSIQKNGQDVGFIHDGSLKVSMHTTEDYNNNSSNSISAAYVPNGKVFHTINKYWDVIPRTQPSKPIMIKFGIDDSDLMDIKSANNNATLEKLTAFSLAASVDPNPETNHEGAKAEHFQAFTYAATLDSTHWNYSRESNGQYTVQFKSQFLNGGSLGYYNDITSPNYNLISFKSKKSGNYTLVEWSTAFEKNTAYFVVEKSKNGTQFDSIGKTAAAKISVSNKNYAFIDNKIIIEESYYRLKIVESNGKFNYSPIISLSSPYAEINSLSIYPNPNSGLLAYAEYKSPLNETIKIQLLDYFGNILNQQNLEVLYGKNTLPIPLNDLNNGIYYVQIISSTSSIKQKLLLNK